MNQGAALIQGFLKVDLGRLSAGGGNRTPMDRSPVDFESTASTNFTTSAKNALKLKLYELKARKKY